MYTDFFKWQGANGQLNWRQILGFYDCTINIWYYINNPPPEPPPYVPPPPIVCTDCNPPPYVPPPVCLNCEPPPVVTVPEPSTWAMMLLGFTGLIYAARRRTA